MTALQKSDEGDVKVGVKPTSQKDLEARRERGYAVRDEVEVNPNEVVVPFPGDGNDTSAYVGVDPVYMNYASDTEKPLRAEGEENVEDLVSDELLSGLAYSEAAKKEGVQTVGTGSSQPHVLVTHSGERVEHVVVDREKVEKAAEEAGRKAAGLPATGGKGEPVRRSEDVKGAVLSGGDSGSKETTSTPAATTPPASPTPAPAPPAAGNGS